MRLLKICWHTFAHRVRFFLLAAFVLACPLFLFQWLGEKSGMSGKILFGFLGIVVQLIAYGGFPIAAMRVLCFPRQSLSANDLLRAAIRFSPKLILTSLWVSLALTTAAVPAIFIFMIGSLSFNSAKSPLLWLATALMAIPAIYFLLRLLFVGNIVLVEQKRPLGSLPQSWRHTSGHVLDIIAFEVIQVVLVCGTMLLVCVPLVVFDHFAKSKVSHGLESFVGIFFQILVIAWSSIATMAFYFRIRRR